ncbi:Pkinase-domain-containing protein [Lichtheimia hyalospora FSU 10163]|nr:Pkinase-domain-containing protein [Lichtheimia hyalospora FSU 10163]
MKRFLSLVKKSNHDTTHYPPALTKVYKVSHHTLGTGSFAIVKVCTHRKTGQTFALKIINKRAIAGREHMLDNELDVLKQVRHPHIITMQGMYEDNEAVYIVTDHAKGGEFFDRLLRKGSYTEKDASNLLRQVLEALAYLHEHDIVHRDIKPENLLFQTSQDTEEKLMIADFGLSRILKEDHAILMTACGTPGYVAPEILLRAGHGTAVDLWSVGVIMYTMLSGYTPFWQPEEAALFDSIIKGDYQFHEEYWGHISDAAKDLIQQLLQVDPSKRITAAEALCHPWIAYEGNELDESASSMDRDIIINVRRGFTASRQSLLKPS